MEAPNERVTSAGSQGVRGAGRRTCSPIRTPTLSGLTTVTEEALATAAVRAHITGE